MGIQVTRSGMQTTIQDQGRSGYQRYGFSVSGAMDQFSYRLANLLVGNTHNEAVIEMAVQGGSFSFSEPTTLAITGADCSPRLNGVPITMYQAVHVEAGDELTTDLLKSGMFSYVGFFGGLKIPEVMGSQSTSTRYGIGGLEGRALKSGDTIQFKTISNTLIESQSIIMSLEILSDLFDSEIIRYVPTEDDTHFEEGTQELFCQNDYSVSVKADRMGYRLEGQAVEPDHQQESLSEATVLGDIQIPPDGKPIVLLADRQTTGGYPVIGTICSVDIPKMVQCRPGKKITFVSIPLKEAQDLLAEQEELFSQWAAQLTDPERKEVSEKVSNDKLKQDNHIEWNPDQIKDVIRRVDKSKLTYFSYESNLVKVKLDKRQPQLELPESDRLGENTPVEKPDTELIQSTLVGVYFTHSERGNQLYIKEGDHVVVGQVVGRIEALKISNDVIAFTNGIVRSIYVENDQMVEYGMPLMEVELDSES